VGEERVVGSALLEWAPDGSTRTVWSAFDSFDPVAQPSLYPDEPGWTHANALDYDATTDSYWLSLRNIGAIVRIERNSGEIVESIGLAEPTLRFADPADAFDGQHQFQWLSDGLLVFNNSWSDKESRPVEYAVDEARTLLTKRWEYAPEIPIWNYALGDVERDPDGGTRITYSVAGLVRQVDAVGALRWQMSSSLATGFGYSSRGPELRQ